MGLPHLALEVRMLPLNIVYEAIIFVLNTESPVLVVAVIGLVNSGADLPVNPYQMLVVDDKS